MLRGERFEIALHQLGAGRILVGLAANSSPSSPAGAPPRLIDVVFPWREQLDVAPLAHGVADIVAGFQHDRLQAALQHMRGGGEADRAGADDRDGLRLRSCHSPIILEISKFKAKTQQLHAAVLASVRFGALGAAFGDQKAHQLAHHVVVGVADQRGRLAHLGHEADHHQRLDVMGEGGGRDLQLRPAGGRPACPAPPARISAR